MWSPVRSVGLGLVLLGLVLAATGPTWAALTALLVGFLLATRRLEGLPFVAVSLVSAAGLLLLAARAGLTATDLGLGRGSWVRGLLWSVVLVAAVALGVAAGTRVPAVRRLLVDPRHVGPGAVAARRVLLDVPVGTVLLEELAFRGVMLALLWPQVGKVWAVVVTSALFGLWHVLGAIDTDASVTGTVALTTVGGAVFAVLRLATGSLLPPAALHWALNGLGTLAGWLVTRRDAVEPEA